MRYVRIFGEIKCRIEIGVWPATFTGALDAGLPMVAVESALLGSQEYRDGHGGSDPAFLSALYQDVLGRPIDPSGSATWQAARAPARRAAVSRKFQTCGPNSTIAP